MDCRKLDSSQAFLLATGGTVGLLAILQHRHLSRCSDCRRRYEEALRDCSGLSTIAAVPVSDTVHSAVFAQIPFSSAVDRAHMNGSHITLGGRYRVKKLTLVLLGAVLIIGVSAAMAPRLIFGHMDCSVGPAGSEWNVSTDFKGDMVALGPDGHEIGVLGNGAGDPSAPVDITIRGQRFHISGYGPHVLRTPSGLIIGTMVLSPQSAAEEQAGERDAMSDLGMPSDTLGAARWAMAQELSSTAGSGSSSGPGYCEGFVRSRNVFWFVRGFSSASLIDPITEAMIASSSCVRPSPQMMANMPLPPNLLAKFQAELNRPRLDNPQSAITVDGRTTVVTGFGRFKIVDSTGKLLYWFEVSRTH